MRLGGGEARAHAHACARLDRRNESDLVQPVIEPGRGIRRDHAELHHHRGDERQAEIAVRDRPADETANAIEDTSDDPEVVVQKKDTGEALRKCLTALSPEHREIVDLVYYHEKSVEEVAEIVGIPENTVKTRLFYARKKLAELLKAAGIERGWP